MRGLYKLRKDYQELPISRANNDESLTGAACGTTPFNPERRSELDPLMLRNTWSQSKPDLERIALCGSGGNETWHRFIRDSLPKFLEWHIKIDSDSLDAFKRVFVEPMEEYVVLQSRVLSLLRACGEIENYLKGDEQLKMRLYCDQELKIKDDIRALVRLVAPYMNFVFSTPEHHITEAHIMGEVPIDQIPQWEEPDYEAIRKACP